MLQTCGKYLNMLSKPQKRSFQHIPLFISMDQSAQISKTKPRVLVTGGNGFIVGG